MGNTNRASHSTKSRGDSTASPPAEKPLLVWVDAKAHASSSANQYAKAFGELSANFSKFHNADECVQFLEKDDQRKAVVITSGSLAEGLLPRINGMARVASIYIFCSNSSYHQHLTEQFSKVRGVHTQFKELCDAIREEIKPDHSTDESSLTNVPVDHDTDQGYLNLLDTSFLHTKLLKIALIDIPPSEIPHQYFLRYLNEKKAKDPKFSTNTDVFQRNYRQANAIEWFFKEPLLSRTLNNALRLNKGEELLGMASILCDLHRNIEASYQSQQKRRTGDRLCVYHWQRWNEATVDFIQQNMTKLIGCNQFLLAHKDPKAAQEIFKYKENKAGIDVLFMIVIDPKASSVPFFETEHGEILFSTHTVFHINETGTVDKQTKSVQMKLSLVDDIPKEHQQWIESVGRDTSNYQGWARIGTMLIKMNQLTAAENLYKLMLEKQSPSESKKVVYYTQLGTIAKQLEKYDEALKYYGQAEKLLADSDLQRAEIWNKIGEVYMRKEDGSNAQKYYHRARDVLEKSDSVNHKAVLATTFEHFGKLYDQSKFYDKALENHQRALKIRTAVLPPTHLELASSYNNIGKVYEHAGNYSTAAAFYAKAQHIRNMASSAAPRFPEERPFGSATEKKKT